MLRSVLSFIFKGLCELQSDVQGQRKEGLLDIIMYNQIKDVYMTLYPEL
jgi:hypothetical protein